MNGSAATNARREDDETGADLGRVLALSDGVFAIALTVLVLEIALPAATTEDTLGRALRDLGPKYFAYVLSFLTIGTSWFLHRLLFRRAGSGRSSTPPWFCSRSPSPRSRRTWPSPCGS